MLLTPQQQKGKGLGSDALQWVKENPDEIAKKAWENKGQIFQYLNNSQRYIEKNIKKNTKPIRYLDEGEIHIPLMSYCGPGTNLDKYRNFQPYNSVDNACRTHDLEFEKAFKLPLGSKERQEAIRMADEKAVKELDKFQGMYGQKLARGGLALKQKLEDIDPSIIRTIMGEAYVGVEPELKKESKEDRRREVSQIAQRGGLDAIDKYLWTVGPLTAGMLYLEAKAGKKLYDLYKNRNEKEDDTVN
jgi:hypothetical protein